MRHSTRPERISYEATSFAGRAIPLGIVGFALEVGSDDPRLHEVCRIFDDSCVRNPLLTHIVMPVEVLRQNGILAVGDAVPSQITGTHASSRDR